MESSFLKFPKKKHLSKTNSLTSVEKLKTPKDRRKSLGSVLPTPNVSKKKSYTNRRKSLDSVQNSKRSEKQEALENASVISTTQPNQDGRKQSVSLEYMPSTTSKKAIKRRLGNNDRPTISNSKKKNIQQSTCLVLAPEEENQTGSLVKASKALRKVSNNRNLKFESSPEYKARIENLEKKYSIKSEDVENAVKGVTKFASNNPYLQNKLFNEEISLFLQINSFKVPKTKGSVKQLFRIPMTHSILPSDADICLIVPDVKGIKNDEHEKHLEHYENLLRSKGVNGIKKIMTFHEFRTEYETFELKNRLVDLYDVFLVDGKISGKVVSKCGSIFYKKRKVPVAIKLHVSKLKLHIDKALKKAYFHLNVKSDSHIVQIGHSKNSINDLVENVYSVIQFLDKQFPGKMGNIRSLNVYAHRGSSIPIYVSLKNPNEIKVPTLSSKKPKAYKSFSGELTTQYNANVVVRPSGHVIVRRKKAFGQNEKNLDDNITDAEILRENKKIDQMEQQNGDGNKNTKSGKKRKLSESEKDQQVVSKESNLVHHSEQSDQKKKKIKKPTANSFGKQEVINNSAEGNRIYKGNTNNSNKNVTENSDKLKKGSINKITQKTSKKKQNVVVTKVKPVGKGNKAPKAKLVKTKNKKKTPVV